MIRFGYNNNEVGMDIGPKQEPADQSRLNQCQYITKHTYSTALKWIEDTMSNMTTALVLFLGMIATGVGEWKYTMHHNIIISFLNYQNCNIQTAPAPWLGARTSTMRPASAKAESSVTSVRRPRRTASPGTSRHSTMGCAARKAWTRVSSTRRVR